MICVATFETQALPEHCQPQSEGVYRFINSLVDRCQVVGEGNAFRWFSREELGEIANDFFQGGV